MFSLSTFEHQLVMYITADDNATFSAAFDLSNVPVVSYDQALAEERTKKLTSATPTLKTTTTAPKKAEVNGAAENPAAAAAAATQKYSQALQQIPELKAHGTLLHSSQPVQLTESETEYVVTCIKHIFTEHLVLQYEINNGMSETLLEDVSVLVSPADDEVEEEFTIPIPQLSSATTGTVYVSFKKDSSTPYPTTSFTNLLKFTSKEVDPATGEAIDGGYEDEFPVEDLDLSGSDYMIPAFAGSFDHAWETTGANGDEASETIRLSNTRSIAGMFWPLSTSCLPTSLCFPLSFPLCFPLSFPPSFSAPIPHNAMFAVTNFASSHLLFAIQMQSNNSPKPYPYNPSTAPTSQFPLVLTN